MSTNEEQAEKIRQQVFAAIEGFGHNSLDTVTLLDGMDIIATLGEGWIAALASHLYFKALQENILASKGEEP